MNNTSLVAVGIGIPLLGTTLGAFMVFFMRGEMNQKLQKCLLGFASGVMIAASVWSLLIPAIDMAEAAGGIAWLPAVAGFLTGIAFLLILDSIIPTCTLTQIRLRDTNALLAEASCLFWPSRFTTFLKAWRLVWL